MSAPDTASVRELEPGPVDRRPHRYETRLVFVLFFAVGFVLFDRQSLALLAPYMDKDFGLSNTQLGQLAAALSLMWAISGTAVGAVADRLSRRKPLLIAAVLLFSLFSSLSGFVGGFVGLLVARSVMGITEGGVIPLSQSLMMEASRPRRRGLNMGIVQGASAGLLGGVAAPLLYVWIADNFGWRVAFFVSVVPGIVVALAIWRIVKEHPLGTARRMAEQPEKVSGLSGSSPVPIGPVLRMRNVVLCILMAVFFLVWFSTLMTFTPMYLVTVRDWSAETMSVVMTCLGIAWAVWGFVAPGVSDRIGRRPALVGFTVLALCCPLCVLAFDSPVILGLALCLTFTGVGCFTIFMAVIPAETVPAGALATTVGIVMGAGEAVGGTLGPVVAGWASDRWGLQAAMLIAAGSTVVVLVLGMCLRETAPRIVAASKLHRAGH